MPVSKTVEELTSFYNTELYSSLEDFEKKRKKLRFQIIFIFIIIFWNMATVYFFFFYGENDSINILIFFIAVLFALTSFLYKYLKRDYRSEFKENIIKPLIKELDSNLHYSANLHINKVIFNNSQLFSKPDKFNGNDFIVGEIDSTKIQFSDIHAQKKYKDSKGRTKYSTIFQGLFIIADFNKDFHGRTIILPDLAQSSFGNIIGSWLQSKNASRDELVKMDNPTFEKEFVVYSTDQIEARYILSHSFMERLLNFREKTNREISISFVKNSIHIAINYGKDLFEPSVFKSLLNDEITKEYIETLVLAASIVEELKLNERLYFFFHLLKPILFYSLL